MSKKTLQVIYYLIVSGIVLATGYIGSFSDRWMVSVLVISGVIILVTYIVNRRSKHKGQVGDSTSASKDF